MSTKAKFGNCGIQTDNISKTISPGDDFYQYVNEKWLNETPIPEGFPSTGSFMEIFLDTEKQIETLIQDLIAGKMPDAIGGKQIQSLYTSYMDQETIEELGLSSIQKDLDDIMNLDNHIDVVQMMAKPTFPSIIGSTVTLDQKNPEIYTLQIYQSGITLPERSYYLEAKEPFDEHRKAYKEYIISILSHSGINNSAQRAKDIIDFETEIAKAHWLPEDMRDSNKNYHAMNKEELIKYAPGFDWNSYFDTLGVGSHNHIVISSDTAIKKIAELFKKTNIETLRSYMAFRLINGYAPLLPQHYENKHFEFFEKRINGVKEQRPRDKRVLMSVSDNLGEMIGRLYVERHFPKEHKEEVITLIKYITEALRNSIEHLSWMDDNTKKEALAKLDSFKPKIGYTDHWRDFSSITIDPKDLIGNHKRIQHWHYQDALSKLGKPCRTWEWYMNPHTVNAYYRPTRNEIVFPAAILQAPFFDINADPAVNFGAIGAVIAHEMVHGFDDQGSKYDSKGILRNWWTPDTRTKFEEKTKALIEQYDAYEPVEGFHVNGKLTLGENIADLSGLALSHAGYRLYIQDKYTNGKPPIIDGMSGEQRFFLSFSQIWRRKNTDQLTIKYLKSDPHSPHQYRANGTVPHIDAWYDAFDVTEKDQMYTAPEKRIKIW